LKLFLEWGKRGKRRLVEGVNSSTMYLIYCKNFCKYLNVPPTQHNNKRKRKRNSVWRSRSSKRRRQDGACCV
jgi:hypothetical protein